MANFGRKVGSLQTLKKTLEKGAGGGGTWIKYIPKNGTKMVRFAEEPENWVNYVEHFDQIAKRSFPCTGEASCPGCLSGERKSSRYLANAIEIDDKGHEQIIPLQLPKDLANRLVVRYERNGTLTDRDFELIRSGEGLDTIYELDAQAPRNRNLAKHTPHDLMTVLEDAYKEVFGSDDDDDDDADEAPPVKAALKARGKSKAAKAIIDVEDDEGVEPEPDIVVKTKPAERNARQKAGKTPEPAFEPDEDDVDVDVDDDDEEEYDEETLRNMPLGALRAVARDFGVNPKGMDQDEIVDAILESGEDVEDDEDDEDQPPF